MEFVNDPCGDKDMSLKQTCVALFTVLSVCVVLQPAAADPVAAPKPLVTIEVKDLAIGVKPGEPFKLSQIPKRIAGLNGKRVRIYGDMALLSLSTGPAITVNNGELNLTKRLADIRFITLAEVRTSTSPRRVFTIYPEIRSGEKQYVKTAAYHAPIEFYIPVELSRGTTTEYVSEPIVVEGRLVIRPVIHNGRLFEIYKIDNATVRPTNRRNGFKRSIVPGC
jgi:hypothetical protein